MGTHAHTCTHTRARAHAREAIPGIEAVVNEKPGCANMSRGFQTRMRF